MIEVLPHPECQRRVIIEDDFPIVDDFAPDAYESKQGVMVVRVDIDGEEIPSSISKEHIPYPECNAAFLYAGNNWRLGYVDFPQETALVIQEKQIFKVGQILSAKEPFGHYNNQDARNVSVVESLHPDLWQKIWMGNGTSVCGWEYFPVLSVWVCMEQSVA